MKRREMSGVRRELRAARQGLRDTLCRAHTSVWSEFLATGAVALAWFGAGASFRLPARAVVVFVCGGVALAFASAALVFWANWRAASKRMRDETGR